MFNKDLWEILDSILDTMDIEALKNVKFKVECKIAQRIQLIYNNHKKDD